MLYRIKFNKTIFFFDKICQQTSMCIWLSQCLGIQQLFAVARCILVAINIFHFLSSLWREVLQVFSPSRRKKAFIRFLQAYYE